MTPWLALTEPEYTLLRFLNEVSGDQLRQLLNSHGPAANWTVCPECHWDDFVHVESCQLGKTEMRWSVDTGLGKISLNGVEIK